MKNCNNSVICYRRNSCASCASCASRASCSACKDLALPERLEILQPIRAITEPCGIAIDLGTTNIAFELVNLQNGEAIARYSRGNSQQAFGADVVSRIAAANERQANADLLHSYVINDLKIGIEMLVRETALDRAPRVAIVGNTVMLHLLRGLSCQTLGVYPFTPVCVEMSGVEIGDIYAEILPAVSAFVGADVVAGMYFCEAHGYNLLVDLGTNAELALYSQEQAFVTSAAAGTAFEGGDIRGSQMVAICAELIRKKHIDSTGLLQENHGSPLSQAHVREIQLAKSAVRAGIEILLANNKNLQNLFIAGAFGYRIGIDDAVTVGLVPAELKGIAKFVGNSALDGAKKYLLNPEEAEKINALAKKAQEISLPIHPEFDTLFMKYMDFN
ncbi:MAG: ASKHA domain-containing protein [Defluviitaleaceae bacterium]|nr:ASKHA domain-containing protein [Defluviitaleaceae bacterium]